MKKGLNFFSDEILNLNLDSIIGTRIVEGNFRKFST